MAQRVGFKSPTLIPVQIHRREAVVSLTPSSGGGEFTKYSYQSRYIGHFCSALTLRAK